MAKPVVSPGLAKNLASPGFTLHSLTGTVPQMGEMLALPMPNGVPATKITTIMSITTGEIMVPANDASDSRWRWRVSVKRSANQVIVENTTTGEIVAGEPFSVTLIVRD
jgi:hypothetical protein